MAPVGVSSTKIPPYPREGDRMCPHDEGRRPAAMIPGARFVTLEGNDHVLIEGTPAFNGFFEEVEGFLAEHGG